ncbi:hypothetical protein Tco_1575993 [Tanacetum coccineum]
MAIMIGSLDQGNPLHLHANDCSCWKRISEKRTKNQAKTDKTEHGMEEREKDKVKSKPKSKKVKVKVNPEKSKADWATSKIDGQDLLWALSRTRNTLLEALTKEIQEQGDKS